MAVGLEILHFKSYLDINTIVVTHEIIEEIARLRTSSTSTFSIENKGLNNLLDNYNIYEQQILKGEPGKTLQFYLIYVNNSKILW